MRHHFCLRWCGCDQIGDLRSDYSRYGIALRADPYRRPSWMIAFLVLTAGSFSLFGFIWNLGEELRELQSFHESADVSVGVSLAMTVGFFLIRLIVVGWMFKTGYRLRN